MATRVCVAWRKVQSKYKLHAGSFGGVPDVALLILQSKRSTNARQAESDCGYTLAMLGEAEGKKVGFKVVFPVILPLAIFVSRLCLKTP